MGALATARIKEYKIDGGITLLKDPTPLLIEGLSLPDSQPLPGAEHPYVEFGECIFAGPMGSGKSIAVENEFAIAARDMWTEYDDFDDIVYYQDENGNLKPKCYIEFFKAKDIGGTIQRLMESTALIKFVFFDDAVGKGKDSRESMTRENRQGTQKFLVIRHLIAEGVLKAGYVILVLATQDLTAIDKRIRNHAGVLVLKGYVEGCEKFLESNPDKAKIIKRLKYLSYNAAWRHRNDIKKIGIAIDLEGDCYEIMTEMVQERIKNGEKIEPIEWIEVKDGTTFAIHFDELVDFALNKLRDFEGDLTVSELKGAMLPKLAEMERKYYFCEVSEVYFQPIIWTVKWFYKQEVIQEESEKLKEKLKAAKIKMRIKKNQFNELRGYCFELLKSIEDISNAELKGALSQKLREIKPNYESIEIKKKNFTTIIHEAKFDYKQYLVKIAKKNQETSDDEKKTLPNERTNISILILHDVFKKSFQEIADIYGIAKSTAHDRYVKEKAIQQTCLIALENKEIEIEG